VIQTPSYGCVALARHRHIILASSIPLPSPTNTATCFPSPNGNLATPSPPTGPAIHPPKEVSEHDAN